MTVSCGSLPRKGRRFSRFAMVHQIITAQVPRTNAKPASEIMCGCPDEQSRPAEKVSNPRSAPRSARATTATATSSMTTSGIDGRVVLGSWSILDLAAWERVVTMSRRPSSTLRPRRSFTYRSFLVGIPRWPTDSASFPVSGDQALLGVFYGLSETRRCFETSSP